MKLFMKLDHIAGLRSAGGGKEPDPSVAAALAELEGLAGITIHLHSDRSSVQLRDVQVLKETLVAPLNLELSPISKNREHAFDLRPDSITLVQEPKDVRADRWPLDDSDKDAVAAFISAVDEADIAASVFIKPTIDAVRWSKRIGAKVVMLDATPYSMAKTVKERRDRFGHLSDCVRLGGKLGMEVHAGGGIDYRNVSQLARLPFDVLHVGHCLVARAVLVGIPKAVSDMLTRIEKVKS